ncbi:MAG TPA: TetR/AcrR family transcriptional regulator [Pyrinomonadaceae bacterium]
MGRRDVKRGAEGDAESEALPVDVRESILDVAERQFAGNGVSGTTVRAITAEAGVNVAAVNYYFRSKEELYREVVGRRLGPLNEERARLLADCLRRAGGKRPAAKEVLRALAEPSLRLCYEHPHFARLLSRLRYDLDDSLWPAYRSWQAELTEGFRQALAAALPNLSEAELRMRLHYVLGTIQQVWAHCPRPEGETPEGLLASFMAFYAAGLNAPAPVKVGSKETSRTKS